MAVAKTWKQLDHIPEKGETVRVTEYGDDYHRSGTVTHYMSGLVFVDFTSREDVFPLSDLETWA